MGNVFANIADKDARYIAYQTGSVNTIIAEGQTPGEVIDIARSSGKEFIVSFVPRKNETFIF